MGKVMRSAMCLTSLVVLMLSLSSVCGSDPSLTSDFGIDVTSGANLTFDGFSKISDSPAGDFNIFFAFVKQFPALHGLGIAATLLKFGPHSLNSLHSHPRGSELLYVISGTIEAGVVDTSNNLFTATLSEGDVFVFPTGLMHYQINRSQKPATALAAFGSENAGRQSIPQAIFDSMPRIDADVLERAMELKPETLSCVRKRGCRAFKADAGNANAVEAEIASETELFPCAGAADGLDKDCAWNFG